MTDDERAIRELVDTWLSVSRRADLPTVLSLMTDDVVFMAPGREPFGREEFAAAFAGLKSLRIDVRSDIRELQVLDDWAWLRNHLEVSITPPGADAPMRRSGYTLTILRKTNGRWRIARDANLLTTETAPVPP